MSHLQPEASCRCRGPCGSLAPSPQARDPASGLAWWEAQLGALPVGDLTTARIIECRAKLARGEGLSGEAASAATQVRHLALLKHVLSTAKNEWEWLDDNPAARVRGPKEPRGRVRFLSEEERERLLDACRGSSEHRLHALVVLALATGARQGGLLNLRWSDIDLARGHAVLHETKNGERRALALARPAVEVLRAMGQLRRLGCDLVFASRRGIATFPREAWEQALAAAAIEDFRFHDLRHTAASYLAMSGATLAEIAEVLGHKSLVMVKRYAHLSQSHVSGVVQRMSEKFLS